jgi:hypothetical protein
MTTSKFKFLLECSVLLLVTSGVLVFWVVTLMFMDILEDDDILDKYFTRPSVYEIGLDNDPK